MPSSVIRAFHHCAGDKQLDVTFTTGRRYRYLDVPEDTYREMRSSMSKGAYFNQHIRNRYLFVRLADADLSDL